MTAFSWKSPEPTPIAVSVPHSRLRVPAARLSFNNARCNAAHPGLYAQRGRGKSFPAGGMDDVWHGGIGRRGFPCLRQLWPALRQKPPMIRHGKVHCFFDGPKIGESIVYGNSPVGQLFKWTETLGRRDGAVGNVGASSRKV